MTAAPAQTVPPVAPAAAAAAQPAAVADTPGTPGSAAPAPAPAAKAPEAPASEPVQSAKAEAAKPASEEKPAAPQAYSIKALDGHSPEIAADFAKFAAEAGLPADKAQAGYDALAKGFQDRIEKAKADQHAAWEAEVRADAKLGGDKLPQTLAHAAKALELGPPQLREFLNQSGLGNHPAMVAWASEVGRRLSPDTFETGARMAPAPKSLEHRLFPNLK